ncbi:uncharacterized protein PgNI_12160 [Pyricularia grisea]|uniref:Uncharacterized protein n=1 Tax=Pyricularia grisea TaxID=148305 RepID=A0A6P8AQV8_PYRGI|nr:uncharacterized protein PgNI_12160 [Pyricularia grisea]TLD04426.1 hypothetical protein PgNI_12160 [Pyricularia grisea]
MPASSPPSANAFSSISNEELTSARCCLSSCGHAGDMKRCTIVMEYRFIGENDCHPVETAWICLVLVATQGAIVLIDPVFKVTKIHPQSAP